MSFVPAADPVTGAAEGALPSIGWEGFLDAPAIIQLIASLVLATLLGAMLAYHPITRRTVDTIAEAELPKVTIMYALVGAIVGVVVLEFGLVIGFVIFGLGGLMRFRTETESTRDTGRLIIATLVGLISGLNFPHFAVTAAVFAWLLIFVLDANPIVSLEVRDIPKDQGKQAADTYRAVLTGLGARMFSENVGLSKGKLTFVFRPPRKLTQATLQEEINKYIPADLRGELDWHVE
jgi:hypothetical protein